MIKSYLVGIVFYRDLILSIRSMLHGSFIDEVPVPEDDLEKMKSQAKTSLSQTLSSCARTAKSVLALRTGDLKEMKYGEDNPSKISPAELSAYIATTKHSFLQLSLTMRTCASIRSAAQDNMKEYISYDTSVFTPVSAVPGGVCPPSTVQGSKPWCVLAQWSGYVDYPKICLLYTSPSPRDGLLSRMPSSA